MKRALATVFAGLIICCGLLQIPGIPWARNLPRPAAQAFSFVQALHIVNGYGLFAVMTTRRPELIIQGSNDGVNWQTYEFKYKPRNVKRARGWVAPYQPRLDWQMWFAALGSYQESPWFIHFVLRLLQGSPQVLSLLGKNPFPQSPPRYIRALLYIYHFTDFSTRRVAGAWWWRELKGLYLPPVTLR